MEMLLTLTFILVLAELFEAYVQYSNTLYGALEKLYYYYKKSIFYFFAIQPGFYTIILIAIYTDILNVSMIFLLFIKVLDMFLKLDLIQKVFIKKDISSDIDEMLRWKTPTWFYFIGVGMYPPLLFMALL